MHDVLLAFAGGITVGWNESTELKEDPSYCSNVWSIILNNEMKEDDERLWNETVTHWMPLPDRPHE